MNVDLGAGLDLTALVQLNPALVFIVFAGLWLEIRFGFTSGLGLSLNIGLSLVLGLKGVAYDKKS